MPVVCSYTGVITSGDDEDISDVIELCHKESCSTLRFTYAFCYCSAQGTTIRDHLVVIFHTGHRHIIMGHFNVGLSIATHGHLVHVPNVGQHVKLIEHIAGRF